MEFDILGPLRVSPADGAFELGAPAQRTLLAVLLTSPNVPVSDDRLADELWGDTPPPSAHHLVQVYVSRLRALLGEHAGAPRIVREGSGYALRVRSNELDADRFLAAVTQGRELRDRDPEAADKLLADAMLLWRGVPFADILEPPPAVREHARYLEREHLEALETWFQVRLQLGRHHELVPELSVLVERHPYHEALHVQLVLALYRSGRQAEALQTARALQVRLREEGIDPSSEIRDLYRDLLLQAPHLSLAPPEVPSNLPTRLTTFVGRARELQEVADLLEASRLLTLTGPGGIGKTRLALEVARRVRAQFPGGVWWIDLASVAEPASVLDELARILGVTSAPTVEPGDAVARALGRRRALLLLDNCEHVVTGVAEALEGVLRATTGPHVLATSRTPLGIEHERRWTVSPLSLPPETGPATRLDKSDAVRLFVERARAVSPSFTLDAENADAVAEICRRLDGMSLAIEIAAARLRELPPREIARRLDERFALLELSAVEGLTRHRTLEAALDASYVLLSDAERAVFERLSTFVGPFDLDAAAAVGSGLGEPSSRALSHVMALARASLLTPERDGVEKRYRLLETLREYGITRLRARGAEEEARRIHAGYHLGLAVQAGAVLSRPDFAPWVDRLALSYAEIRRALAWSLEHDDRALALRAAPALRELWLRLGWAREAGLWSAWMLEGDLDDVPPDLLAEVHNAAAFAAEVGMNLAGAAFHAEEAVRLARGSGDTPSLAFGLFGRAVVAFAGGDIDSVRRFASEALEVCEEHGDRWGRARPLAVLGFASLAGGAVTEARALLEEALPLDRELGDLGNLVIMALTPLTLAALAQGDLDAAERYAAEALEVGRGVGWEASALTCYAEVLSARKDPDAAEAAASRALRVAFETGLETMFRVASKSLARITAERGRYERAAVLLASSRRNMPWYGHDPAFYESVEQQCREALGDDRFEELAGRGRAINHDELLDFVGAGDP